MAVAARWISETPDLFIAAKWDWMNQAWLHLIVEALPDGVWDWAAWSSDDTCRSLHGIARDRFAAMALAEHAAAAIGSVRVLASA